MALTNPARRRIPWLPLLTVGAISLVILAVMNPALILTANTPTGGDMGAHVLGPAFLRDVLLPRGRLMGWSDAWFAGFPAFYFYFPLPSLVIVLLDVVLPYGVAFKLVTVAGLVALPPAGYFLARSMGFGRTIAIMAAAAAAPFVFMESYSIYGANIASTLAGEFSFSWSFALGMVYLGLLIRAVRDDRRYIPWAALFLGLTMLSHILTTIVLAFASLPVLLSRRGLRRGFAIAGWGAAISGFWLVPLVARIHMTSDMAWTPLRGIDQLLPVEIWILLPLAFAGMVWSVRAGKTVAPLIIATFLPVLYYPLPNVLPRWFPSMFSFGRWKLWNGRLLPYWYFGVAFFAMVAIGAAVVWLTRRLPERVDANWARLIAAFVGVVSVLLMAKRSLPGWVIVGTVAVFVILIGVSLLMSPLVSARSLATVTVAGVVTLGALAGVTFVAGWAKWNYEGYEAKQPYKQYEALMQTIDGLPPGRILWEGNNELDKYGTPMALMLFPYWSPGHPSMEGLYFESSLTTPFHFIMSGEMSRSASNPVPDLTYHNFDFERGLAHARLFGVRYYVSYTPEAAAKADKTPGLVKVASSPPFNVYEIPGATLVDALPYYPGVFQPADGTTFGSFALSWYDDIAALDHIVTETGPASWPRVSSVSDALHTPATGASGGAVTNVVSNNGTFSFDTTAIGVPHLVKVSYFPNWRATGADGPYRATPSLMVVVPRQSHVVLTFANTWAENTGDVLSILGVLALIVWPFARRRIPDDQVKDSAASPS